jgi:hypothetical protein
MFSRIFRRRADRSVPRTFEGDVIYADTGSPVAGARLAIDAIEGEHVGNIKETTGQADHVGHFKLTPHLGKWFWIRAYPLAGDPYLPFEKRITLAKDDPTPRIELSLPRGIMVCGTIVEAKSGNPVSGASVQYESGSRLPEGIVTGWMATVLSDANGAFQIAVPPGQGALFVYGSSRFTCYPSNIYSYRTVETREFNKAASRVNKRHYVHGWVPLDLNAQSEPPLPTITVRRSVPVRGRLVGPSGLPVEQALMLSRLCVGTDTTGFRCFPVAIVDGKFELNGLDCHERAQVFFLDPRNQFGATVEILGRSGESEPLVVHLNPCGRAIARFIDPEGKPLVKFRPPLHIVVTPGPGRWDYERWSKELASDEDFVANFDQENHHPLPVTDRHGRCTFPALIPGATYRLPVLRTSGEQNELDFIVQAGQTLQLPDITLKSDY